MGFPFSKPTAAENLRRSKREITRCIRELDREQARLECEEQRLTRDIRKVAKKGEMSSARIMAHDIVRIRRHQTRFYQMRSQLHAVSLKLETMKSTSSVSELMADVAKAMGRMNEQVNLPAFQTVADRFLQESQKLEQTQNSMNRAIDGTVCGSVGEAEDDAAVDALLEKILNDGAAPKLFSDTQANSLILNAKQTKPDDGPPLCVVGVSIGDNSSQGKSPAIFSSPQHMKLEESLEERLRNLKL